VTTVLKCNIAILKQMNLPEDESGNFVGGIAVVAGGVVGEGECGGRTVGVAASVFRSVA
jgi:hypothetical protein